jgi:excisionase family DNA binding protein
MSDEKIIPAVYTVPEAAKYLKLGRSTMYKLIREGKLPHVRVGKSIRFVKEALDRYLARGTSTEWKADTRGRPSAVDPAAEGRVRGRAAKKA